MRITIKGVRLEITPAFHAYIEEKIGSCAKLIARYEKTGECMVFIEVARTTRHHHHGDVFFASCTLTIPHKKLYVTHTDEDARVAIDVVRDMLKQELERYKEKTISVRGRSVGDV